MDEDNEIYELILFPFHVLWLVSCLDTIDKMFREPIEEFKNV